MKGGESGCFAQAVCLCLDGRAHMARSGQQQRVWSSGIIFMACLSSAHQLIACLESKTSCPNIMVNTMLQRREPGYLFMTFPVSCASLLLCSYAGLLCHTGKTKASPSPGQNVSSGPSAVLHIVF